jgi:hypothetical protein
MERKEGVEERAKNKIKNCKKNERKNICLDFAVRFSYSNSRCPFLLKEIAQNRL